MPPLSTASNLRSRKIKGRIYAGLFLAATLLGVLVLVVLIARILVVGVSHLDWQFITSYPSRFPEQAGILSALVGTLWMMTLTMAFSVPLGIGASLYLEYYAPKNRWTDIVNTNISNLAGVPSIVYGLLGLTVFVRWLSLERSVLAGSLTMTLLILPITIIAAREALLATPASLATASYALGANKWQTIRRVTLPFAFPGILTGIILSMSRAIGETAPLIMIGALTYIAFIPGSSGLLHAPLDPFTALPIQVFNWTSRPQAAFQEIAATGIIVLLVVLLTMNAVAILLRDRFQKKIQD